MQDTTDQTESTEIHTPQFFDNDGTPWYLRLDFARLQLIRDTTGLDFGQVDRIAKTWAELLLDDDKALAVVWIACGERPGDDNYRDWLTQMDGVALESAINAFRDALYLFTRPLRRQVVAEGIDTINREFRRVIAEASTEIRETVRTATTAAKSSAMKLKPLGRSAPASAD